jgi:hypothetical protein
LAPRSGGHRRAAAEPVARWSVTRTVAAPLSRYFSLTERVVAAEALTQRGATLRPETVTGLGAEAPATGAGAGAGVVVVVAGAGGAGLAVIVAVAVAGALTPPSLSVAVTVIVKAPAAA